MPIWASVSAGVTRSGRARKRNSPSEPSGLTSEMKIFFDGGCRPNPGRMEVAAFARGRLHHRSDLGPGSSHEAEWLALLHALEVARSLGETRIELLGDSASVIAQARGLSKPGAEYLGHLAEFREAVGQFERLRIRHVARTQNLAGIALAKLRDAARDVGPAQDRAKPAGQ